MKMLVTERLTLRPYARSDLERLAEILADPRVTRFVFKGTPFSLAETQEFIKHYFLRFSTYSFGLGILCESASGYIIGCGGITPCDHLESGHADYEIGFALAESAWGCGYATDIARRLIEFAFQELALERMLAAVHPSHVASRKVLEKVGMRYVKECELGDRGLRYIYCITNT